MIFRLRQSIGQTFLDDIPCPRSRLFDVAFVIHRFSEQRVCRYGLVVFIQLRNGQPEGQHTRIPDLQTVAEEHDLHTAIASVIAVTDRVDYRLLNRLHRQFRMSGNAGGVALAAGSGPVVQTAHDESCCLIDQFKDIPLVNLVCRKWPFHLVPEKLNTLNLRCNKKFLRFSAKKQDRGIFKSSINIEQIKMDQKLFRRRFQCQRKIPLAACGINKIPHFFFVQIRHDCVGIFRGIERKNPYDFFVFQIAYQRSINRCPQTIGISKGFPDHIFFRLGDQHCFALVSRLFGSFFDEYQPSLVQFGGFVVFTLGGGNTPVIDIPVFVPENAKINIAQLNLFQIDLLCRGGLCRTILEDECIEELAEKRVLPDIGT